jgi:prolyl-tRNA editing enzyme YbaK/EbsC (Cys-tRNA(Pro) deacylase)
MFGLSETDLGKRILGCGDGPAAFNADLTRRGGRVVSIDPVYAFDAEQIRGRIAETYDTVMTQLRRNRDDFVWGVIPSVEELGTLRMAAMETFLADFAAGKLAGRYLPGELPELPFADGEFDLALSSHFLFLYSDHLSQEFHLQALREMLRVADEVRVFPLVTLANAPSPHLQFVMEQLESLGFSVEVRRVPYEFQRNGNEMLVIRHEPEKDQFEQLLAIVAQSGVAFTLHEHAPARTMADAEQNLAFEVGRIVKTVVFRTRDGRLVLAALRGIGRVDYPRLAALAGVNRRDLSPLAPEEVRERLGVEPGSVSPLMQHEGTTLFIDDDVLTIRPTVYCGIGRSDRTLEVAPTDLVALANGSTGSFSK